MLISLGARAQNIGWFNRGYTQAIGVSTGYVPSYNALKFSVEYNNFYKPMGAYTSFETGLDDGRFTHILGTTVSIIDQVFVFGGLDLFTSRGLFSKGLNGRKEFGVAWVPIPNATVKVGYSFTVGVSFQAGFRIPLMKIN